MFNALLPRHIDNAYRGHKVALWLFGLVLFVKLAISVNSIFNGHTVASSADGIPLDTLGSTITLVLLAVMIVGLALSLWSRENHPAPR